MRRTGRALVLKDPKIVVAIGQIATLPMLRGDLKSKCVSPKAKSPLQVTGSDAYMNEY
jgi:hypothetical protein